MIGVFDSGVGGLGVLREIRSLAPEADLLYAADTAHAPYGPRSLPEVEALSHRVARWLLDRGADTLVVACNTASAAALASLRHRHPDIPIVGMEPAVKPASLASESGTIAVFATKATFQGELYATAVAKHAPDVDVVEVACPAWVTLVESGEVSGERARQAVSAGIEPAIEAGADRLVLGCTHFSFLRPLIESATGSAVDVVDPATAVAKQATRVATSLHGHGSLRLATSGNAGSLRDLAYQLANIEIEDGLLRLPA